MEPLGERYGYYSPALGPVLYFWLPRPRAHHANAVLCRSARPAGRVHLHPAVPEARSRMESCRRASRGAGGCDGGCRPTYRHAIAHTRTGCLGRRGFLGYPRPWSYFQLRKAPGSAKIGALFAFPGQSLARGVLRSILPLILLVTYEARRPILLSVKPKRRTVTQRFDRYRRTYAPIPGPYIAHTPPIPGHTRWSVAAPAESAGRHQEPAESGQTSAASSGVPVLSPKRADMPQSATCHYLIR
jgi:hypothetical protein